MPKATRKKKLKAEDFQKKKLKVGKKVAPAENQTDVSFKTQKIALRPQRFAMTHEEAMTAAGKQQRFKDLLGQCRHYNPQSRKEALTQIQDLLSPDDTELVFLSLGIIANDVVALILDETHSVRKLLIAVLTNFFGWVDEGDIMPFGAVIVAYTTSAMSHIADSVRLDGLCLLKLLLSCFPKIVSKHSHTIMPHFMSLLSSNAKNQNGGSSGLGVGSALNASKGREQLLDSFYGFLQLVIPPKKSKIANLDESTEDMAIIEWDKPQNLMLLQQHMLVNSRYQESVQKSSFFSESIASTPSDRLNISGISATKTIKSRSYTLVTKTDIQNLFEDLYPRLIDFWIESSVIFQSPTLAWSSNINICLLVVQILLLVTQTEFLLSPEVLSKCRATFSKHVSQMFPFGATSSVVDEKIHKILAQMNLGYCKISLQLLTNSNRNDQVTTKVVDDVSQYIVQILYSSRLLSVHAPGLDLNVLDAIVYELYVSYQCFDTLQALIDFQTKTKSMQLAFGSFSILARLDVAIKSEEYIKWICTLPYQLIKLKNWHTDFSNAIISFLCQIVKSSSAEFGSVLMNKAVPFFYGSWKKSRDSDFGPFKDVPNSVQANSVMLLHYFPRWSDNMIQATAECFTLWSPAVSTIVSLLDTAHERQKTPELALPHSVYASLMLTIGTGYTQSSLGAVDVFSLQIAQSHVATIESFAAASCHHHQKAGTPALLQLWKRRQEVTKVIPTLVQLGQFLPRLSAMLNMTLPADGYLGVLMLLAYAADSTPSNKPMQEEQRATLISRIAEFETYCISQTLTTDILQRECVILCDKLRCKWIDP
ncbi:hypothetical protein BASA50_009830 [Batrachochytrium salamandrivorans]|uniref:Pre-rRNA-processing protein n=1 Tax=Batrachochytrium salamandrivorans TaxID=1357716 RepID=A0ABQ8F3A8_9FUNG|nr:hypothetical protein BASA62_005405 [Batrachochytrium salamandrivorans]KAH6581800.1 hypothetical protein BASA61_008908 [Batrachochytrium salamandrivorans]KAH6589737.1 hypothetical protein BASA50_009830 [Batrachochytrium salamandrivorans]KAH9264905.1 hypothetical protein BASA83_011573 [Batrachochytrium salamandrivorans]